ncbi:MAG: DUF192 domain-containing protein [Pseudomonadota bacterium]
MVRILALAGSLALAACSPSESGTALAQAPSDAPPASSEIVKHPTSGLQIIEVAVVRGDERIVFKTELANTPAAQARGLMFRTELRDDEAMLFPSGTPQARSFWMKNTPLGLDIIFIGVDGRISNIEEGVPYSTDSVASAGLASAVFEVRRGLSEELGIRPGDRVEYTLPE